MHKGIFILLAIISLGCQRSNLTTPGEIKAVNSSDFVSRNSSSHSLLENKVNQLNKKEEVKEETFPEKENNGIEVGVNSSDEIFLITHNKFAFLEYLDPELEFGEGFREVSDRHEMYSGGCLVYEVDDQSFIEDYEGLIGSEYMVNNYSRDQYSAKVVQIVVIHDRYMEVPYLAAQLEFIGSDQYVYYGWASAVSATVYPYMELETRYEEMADENVMNLFHNTAEYSQFEEVFAMPDEELELELVEFEQEHFNGTKYHIIQYNAIGHCGSLYENLTAVYSERKGKYKQLAIGELDYFFQDLIDINGDGFPEFFGADFAASIIFSMENGRFEAIQEVNWSTDECPC